MKISRRDFLKWSTAAGVALKLNFDVDKFNTVLAAESDPPVIWLQGASCTGCTISTLNVTNPTTIDDVLLNKISMKFHPTLGTLSGNSLLQELEDAANQYNGQFILVIEGAVHIDNYKNYCIIGQLDGADITMYDAVMKYGPMAKYVVAAGTCAAFGGVAKTGVNSDTCASVSTLLNGKTNNTVVNLPACPVHPTVLIQTLIDLILTGMPTVDSNGRPKQYYKTRIHKNCSRHSASRVNQPGVYGCYAYVGCKGWDTFNNFCPSVTWNNNRGWCIEVNYPCIGCAHPEFPKNPLIEEWSE